MYRKHILGAGIYVRDDKDGRPVLIGDRVKVVRPEFYIENARNPFTEDRGLTIYKKEVTGTVVLLLSKGVAVRPDKGDYVFPNLTEAHNSRNPWTWEKLNK